jgi:hypothetical protein
LGEISGTIIEVVHRFINIPKNGEELKNPGTNKRGKAGSSNVAVRQGIRICGSNHLYIYIIFVLISMAYFMPTPYGEGGRFPQNKENVLDDSARARRRNPGQS